ncbi:MAG: hypothetical protein CM1200mP18_18540 [Gammaproteobacteria bacterium]|nr:MAG: hypothetical protein CM1200mP18_18540 [Gammaproteobacteria bacterium]
MSRSTDRWWQPRLATNNTLPQIHAVIVSELLDAGAKLIGKQSLTKFH